MLKLLIILATVLHPLATSFTVNFEKDEELWHNSDDNPEIGEQLKKNVTISLNDFSIFNELGSGKFGTVYIAKKNGGRDDGQLYALKAINITHALEMNDFFKSNSLKNEREVLEAVREIPEVTRLHYAFREGNWVFLIIDLAIGGDVLSQLDDMTPDRARLILAEILIAVEKLHKVNILYIDLHIGNILINQAGHLVLSDFGLSMPLDNTSHATKKDWNSFFYICCQVFTSPVRDANELSLLQLTEKMTDELLPEFKSHPYFDRIDWKKVERRESTPPFDPTKKLRINEKNIKNHTQLFGTRNDDEMDASLIEEFHNYTFIAPEYWN